MALCIPVVGESYDCAKAAISLERSNSFPWPKGCVQIHQTPFPSQRVGSGHETNVIGSFSLEKMTDGRCIVSVCVSSCLNFAIGVHVPCTH